MYCYMIINKINQKKYIGITIDFEKRMAQHKRQKTSSLIHQAIQKYGEENFEYQIIASGLSVEEAEEMEINLIEKENSLVPSGYNIAKGGLYGGRGLVISDEDILYIKSHRNLPEYLLYDLFCDKMSYGYFLQIYRDEVRKEIRPTVEMYPNNLAFSCQFIKTKFTYEDIVNIRIAYAELKDWKELYPLYKEKCSETTFFDIFRGQNFKLIMPEVFSEEIKKKRYSLQHKGERNPNAKLTRDDILEIRRLKEQEKKNVKEISVLYPQVSKATISDIVGYRTWKNI